MTSDGSSEALMSAATSIAVRSRSVVLPARRSSSARCRVKLTRFPNSSIKSRSSGENGRVPSR